MLDGSQKIKDFFGEKTEAINAKIERTPMEKFFVLFLIIITISAVALGYLQLRQNIEQPLQASYLKEKRGELQAKYQLPATNLNSQLATEDAQRLQNQDSDLDGLSDYSEIYLYKTSPYLEDTDGDGKLDKEEVTAGTDPNCPQGQDCSLAQEQPSDLSSVPVTNANLNSAGSALPSLDLNNMVDLENKLLSGEITLSDLGIDDPAMQSMLEQLQSGQLTGAPADTNTNSDASQQLSPEEAAAALAELQKMTPQEIRAELVARGIDASLLDKVDDQTLENLFKQTLNLYQ